MRAKIKVWGNEYQVSQMSWSKEDGSMLHVSFRDENEDVYTFFEKFDRPDNAESMKGKTDRYNLIHTDLESRIYWEGDKHA